MCASVCVILGCDDKHWVMKVTMISSCIRSRQSLSPNTHTEWTVKKIKSIFSYMHVCVFTNYLLTVCFIKRTWAGQWLQWVLGGKLCSVRTTAGTQTETSGCITLLVVFPVTSMSFCFQTIGSIGQGFLLRLAWYLQCRCHSYRYPVPWTTSYLVNSCVFTIQQAAAQ